jgi:hypothetical protein
VADLTTLANVEAWLKLQPGNDDEALLSRLITAVSDMVERWCNRPFLTEDFTETRDGTGSNRMAFGNFPVTAVESVVIDGRVIPAGDAVQTPGFYFKKTMLYLNGYRFLAGSGNVALSYTAGYAEVPPAVEQAVIETIGMRYRERDRIGQSSKGIAGETTAYLIKDLPPSAQTALQPYRKVVLV